MSLHLTQFAEGVWTCTVGPAEVDDESDEEELAQEDTDWKTITTLYALWTSIQDRHDLPSSPVQAAVYFSDVLELQLVDFDIEQARDVARRISMVDVDYGMASREWRLPATAVSVAILCTCNDPGAALMCLRIACDIIQLKNGEPTVTRSPLETDILWLMLTNQVDKIYSKHPSLRYQPWIDEGDVARYRQIWQAHREPPQEVVINETRSGLETPPSTQVQVAVHAPVEEFEERPDIVMTAPSWGLPTPPATQLPAATATVPLLPPRRRVATLKRQNAMIPPDYMSVREDFETMSVDDATPVAGSSGRPLSPPGSQERIVKKRNLGQK
ncbi:hypothetical protein B0H16DRAFT_1589809 [Mycena metata]|uniref:Uncharacterized protein n=1 Tax=Mycena metata TaxID=1033252 RepID=A0AAD7MQA8_9AGAR|nr:hypothetical protein B0H16DRAFT_1589809 [Mycena metata]